MLGGNASFREAFTAALAARAFYFSDKHRGRIAAGEAGAIVRA